MEQLKEWLTDKDSKETKDPKWSKIVLKIGAQNKNADKKNAIYQIGQDNLVPPYRAVDQKYKNIIAIQ